MVDAFDKRAYNTTRLMEVVDSWKLKSSEIMDLLAIEGMSGRHLEKFRTGGKTLPDTPETNIRMEHILAIADALRTTFPLNPKMAEIWMFSKQKKLNDAIPMQRIAEEGIDGLVAIRSYLDCSYCWEQNS